MVNPNDQLPSAPEAPANENAVEDVAQHLQEPGIADEHC